MESRLDCMPPEVLADCRVLILGSLPGAVSLAQNQYYAHPRNQFWPILAAVLEVDLVSLDYPARIKAINARGIGLWDCIASATRKGSLDGAIRAAQANALSAFVGEMSDLRAVAFNGAKAETIGLAQLGAATEFTQLPLPSTSPAHTLPLSQKIAAWQALGRFTAPP